MIDTTCADTDLLVVVNIETLVYLLDPLRSDTWGVGLVTVDQIDQALRDERLRPDNPCWNDLPANTDDHAERIAWLIRHGWDTSEPLQLDVDQHGGVSLNDGNHRLYALAYTGATGPVVVALSGFIDVAEHLLDITIP